MDAFTNAYNFVLSWLETTLADREDITGETVYYEAEQALRDWDAFAGPRHTNYQPEAYELTDSQWYDCLSAVQETYEARHEIVDS